VIHSNNGSGGKAVRLMMTATPPCSRVIDADVGAGDKLGVFERLHVRFYGEARCGYDYHETRLFWGAWHMWLSTFPAARLLVGLPAATDGMRGWLDPATLRDSVLPSVRDDPKSPTTVESCCGIGTTTRSWVTAVPSSHDFLLLWKPMLSCTRASESDDE
jgi:hypothetical protein